MRIKSEFLFAILLYQVGLVMAIRAFSGLSMIYLVLNIIVFALFISNGYLKQIGIKNISFLLIIFILIFLNMVLYPNQYTIIIKRLSTFVFQCIPIFLIGSTVVEENRLQTALYKVGFINFLLVFWIPMTYFGEVIGYMTYSYALLPSCLIFLEHFYTQKSKFSLILGFFSIILILFFGARGPFFIVIIYLLFKLYHIKNRALKVVSMLVIAIITSVSITYEIFSSIISYIINILGSLGVNSYSLNKLLLMNSKGLLESSSGRDIIYQQSIEYMDKGWLFGRGIGAFEIEYNQVYVHNIFLQIFNEFGLVGLIILGFFMVYILFLLLHKKNYTVLLILFLISIPKLLLSSTFWQSPPLFGLIAFVLNYSRKTY